MKKQSKASGRSSRTPAAGKRSQPSASRRTFGSRQQSSFGKGTARSKPGTSSDARNSDEPSGRFEGERPRRSSADKASGPRSSKSRQSFPSRSDAPGYGPQNPSEPHKGRRTYGSSEQNRSRFKSRDKSADSRSYRPRQSSPPAEDIPGESGAKSPQPPRSPRPFSTFERKPKAAPRDGHSASRGSRAPRHRQPSEGQGSETPQGSRPGKSFGPSKNGRGSSRGPQAGDTRPPKRGAGPFRSKGGSFQEFPLNKYIAHCGICSRRKAVDFIKDGLVKINGSVVTEPGTKVQPSDQVQLNGKPLKVQQELVYLLVNKPKGYITTTKDPRARKTVMELIEDACTERVYPVGRLDRNTSGLLLLTNDGDLAQKLSHPSNNIRKVYQAGLDKPLTKADFDKIVQGIELEDGPIHADVLAYSDAEDRTQVGIEIHSGRNHIVRRIFAALGYEVLTLDRVLYAGLTKKNLPRGKWRFLSEREVIFLKHF